jgi:alkyldihydroxyacetonephosphate synthase
MSRNIANAAGIASSLDEGQLGALAAVVGPDHVHTGFAERLAYARDRLPLATFRVRESRLPATLPSAIVCPADHDEVAGVLRVARNGRLPLITFGAGSGVLGGTIPLCNELMLDLKRLNRIVELNDIDGTVTVQAGMNGGQFEAALNARGWTSGHLPQSLHMSTVGGWAACRSAGQASSRYGKIEDIVLGLNAVIPDGRTVVVRAVPRRAVGPSIRDLFVGSEGVFGVITEMTLRIWRKPDRESPLVLAFPGVEAGLHALREIMQSELRPAVARLYDEEETASRAAGDDAFRTHPVLCILVFSGLPRLAAVEEELAMQIAAKHGCIRATLAPHSYWETNRYISYSPKLQASGHYIDTIDVAGPWSAFPVMYQRMRNAAHSLHPELHFGAHWSHVYPEGTCQYMTLRLPPMPEARALALHRQAWAEIQALALEHGGSISHHHGVGMFRNPWIGSELNVGLDVLQALKDALDPHNLVNPGKLGMRGAAGAVAVGADQ